MAGFDWRLQQVCGLLFLILLLSRTDNGECTADYVARTCFPHFGVAISETRQQAAGRE